MAYFKIVRKTLEINGSSRNISIDLRAEVFSYDKNVNKFLFELTSKEADINLTGATVRALLTYVGNDGKKGIIEDTGGVEAYTTNQIYYLLPEELRGYEGTVVMGLYVDLPTGESIDIQNVQFKMLKSSIDDGAGVAGMVYFKSFEDWLVKVKEKALQEIDNIDLESDRVTNYADKKIKEYDDKFMQSNQKMNELQQSQTELSDQLDSINVKKAWSWSADGTDRFTKVYPGENFIRNSTFENGMTGWTATDYWNIDTSTKLNEHSSVKGAFASSSYSAKALRHTSTLGDLAAGDDIVWSVWAKSDTPNSKIHLEIWGSVYSTDATIGTEWTRVSLSGKLGAFPSVLVWNTTPGTFWVSETKLERGDTPTIYTPAPSEDYANAYPTYKGISIVDSDNPADYSWQAEDNTIAKKVTLDSHTENVGNPHKVTKAQVGLGNVDNYSTATQAEAEAGTATNKFMTPSLVFKAIAKWVQGKFVSIAGNETIGGIKNFRDGLMVNGLSVNAGMVERNVTDADRSDTTNVSNVAGRLTRIGNLVFCTVGFTCDSYPTNTTETRWVIKIPDGYKRDTGNPAQTSLSLTRNENQPADARAYISQTSMICVKSGVGYSYVAGMWTTKDAWPS